MLLRAFGKQSPVKWNSFLQDLPVYWEIASLKCARNDMAEEIAW